MTSTINIKEAIILLLLGLILSSIKELIKTKFSTIELIFTMLGEAATTRIAKTKDVQGLEENKVAAQQGGEVAGNARKELEEKTGESVITEENFLDAPEKLKKKKKITEPLLEERAINYI